MNKRFFRYVQILLLLVTLFVIGASFYFQYYQELQPCPLCLMQRFCAFLLGGFLLMGLCLTTLKRARVVIFFQLFFAAAGLFFALRQLWLHSLPADQMPACMPGLSVLIQYFPWQEVFRALFWGTADCGETTWQWLGLSMPAWAGLYFFTVFIIESGVFWLIGKRLKHLQAP